MSSAIVFVVEGEKDVDRLATLGYTAISAPSGAHECQIGEKYRDDLLRLKNRDFIIVPDNDSPGSKLVEEWISALQPLAKSIRFVIWRDEVDHGGDVSDFFAAGRTRADFEEVVRGGMTIPVSRFDPRAETRNEKPQRWPTRLRDFLAEPEMEHTYLVDGLLVAAGTSLLAARPKAGKSTLARYLASCVATGSPFLARAVRPGPVILLQLEEHRDFMRRQLRGLQLTGAEPLLVWCEPVPKDALAWLAEIVAEERPSLVIIDPLLKFIRVSDVNAYAEMSRILEPLSDLARRSGAHLMLVHHLGKGGEHTSEGGSLGSTAIDGVADAILMLHRRDGIRSIQSRQRYGTDIPETNLSYDPTTGFFGVAGETVESRLASVKASVDEVVRANADLTEEEIRDAVRGNSGTVGEAIRSLLGSNQLSRKGTGRRGDPFRYSACDVANN